MKLVIRTVLILSAVMCSQASMTIPTVTIDEVAKALDDPTVPAIPKKVLEAIVNDYMDLQFSKETPFTTGKVILPSGISIEEVDVAATDMAVEKKFRDVFVKISVTSKSGDLTPQSEVAGWDPRLRPVLVVITPNKI